MRLGSVFVVSASLHALIGYSVGVSPVFRQTHAEPLNISYAPYLVEDNKPTAPKPETAAKPVPRKTAAVFTKPVFVQPPSKPVMPRYSLDAPAAVVPRPAPKTSAELIADPKKGKIFIGYFSLVKGKIHKTLRDRYAVSGTESGSVCLYFVLDGSGRLERASVVEKESKAGESLKVLAMRCLHESAPFAAFPRSLNAEHIAFNVTVFFGEN